MAAPPPRDFDQAAASWDEKPQRRQVADAVAAGILAALPLHEQMHALEYGCGTGLVGLQLAPRLGRLTAADSSAGMLRELAAKAARLGLANVVTLQIDPQRRSLLPAGCDLLIAAMVLHHIADTAPLLADFHAALAPGGTLAIADLVSEDGTFHDDPDGVAHHGFPPAALAETLAGLGFQAIATRIIHTIHKQRSALKGYPVFLLTARKP